MMKLDRKCVFVMILWMVSISTSDSSSPLSRVLLSPSIRFSRRTNVHSSSFGNQSKHKSLWNVSNRRIICLQEEKEDNSKYNVHGNRRRNHSRKEVELCLRPIHPIVKNLFRGAFLRVASDLTGGTPLENVKCRVTVTSDTPVEAVRNLLQNGGIQSLWSGTQSRTVEGALMGAMFLVGSTATKKQVLRMGGSKTVAALAGGIVGGVVQAIVMTPAGLIFTSLNMNRGVPGHEHDTAITVARRVMEEKGILGLYAGGGAMALRQASNWASRSMFTELCRTNLKLSRFGLVGEIASGAIGGVGSCWNTPIETVRVLTQRDVAAGKPSKAYGDYVKDIIATKGVSGLFVGVTPRAIQAIWQTVFMVVVPNLLGI